MSRNFATAAHSIADLPSPFSSIERLRGTALVKATNSGKKPPKPLDLKKAPLKPVPFKKANAGKNWVDNTLIKPQSSMLKSAFGLEDDEWY